MAMTMRKPETTAVVPSVAELQAALTALRAEHARTAQRASGTVESWTTKRGSRAIVTQTGAVEHVVVEEPVLVAESIGAAERIQAKRALPDLVDRLSLLEEQLERAKAAAAGAARTQRERAIAAGEQEVRRLLPSLIADVRALQERFVAFHADLARLDQEVGAEYFELLAAPPLFMPGGMADAWCGFVSGAFPPDRR